MSKYNKAVHRRYAISPKGIYNTLKKRRLHKLTISRKDFVRWYILADRKCEYCGITEKQVEIRATKHNLRTKRLTIDRKDNNKGYEENNLVLACDNCNMIKSNLFTYEEMLILGKKSKELLDKRDQD